MAWHGMAWNDLTRAYGWLHGISNIPLCLLCDPVDRDTQRRDRKTGRESKGICFMAHGFGMKENCRGTRRQHRQHKFEYVAKRRRVSDNSHLRYESWIVGLAVEAIASGNSLHFDPSSSRNQKPERVPCPHPALFPAVGRRTLHFEDKKRA